MRDALLARESALRGFAVGARRLPAAYDEATAALAAAAMLAPSTEGRAEERRAIREQEPRRALGRYRQRHDHQGQERPHGQRGVVGCPHRSIERFETANAALVRTVAAEGAAAHSRRDQAGCRADRPAERGFAAAGSLLLARARRAETRHQLARPLPRLPARVRPDIAGDRERERGARARQAAPRALAARLGDRRSEPQQQPEPARGGDTARGGEPTGAKLVDSSPNSCLAVRLGRAHAQRRSNEPLLTCDLCSQHPRRRASVARRRRGDRIRPRGPRAAAVGRATQPHPTSPSANRPCSQPAQPRHREVRRPPTC